MNKTGLSRNTDIEVLRAVAISFTLCSHFVWGLLPDFGSVGAKLQSLVRFSTGVDLFFGISGFIITSSLIKILQDHDPSRGTARSRGWKGFREMAIPFWIRRGFRLLPSAWLWILITLFLAAKFNSHAALNVANFYFYERFAQGYVAHGTLGVFWSLSLEEQFYLLLPILLYFVRRRFLIPVLLAAFFIQVFIHRPAGYIPGHTSLLWFTRTDALILGVLIALWKQHPSYQSNEPRFLRRGGLALPLVGLCILMLAMVPAFREVAAISTGLVAIISGVLVLMASYDHNYILRPSRFKTAMVWLGSRSYSIYLIHATCYAFSIELAESIGITGGNMTTLLLTIWCIFFTLALSEINYQFIEAPFRRIGRRLADDFSLKLKDKSAIIARQSLV
jgi:peptidoglycan/LPS O-acetylase OafA/YrhL